MPLTSSPPWTMWDRRLLRVIGGSAHLVFFILPFCMMIPVYASEGRKYNTPSPRTVVFACSFFVLSLVIARLMKRETIVGLLIKSIVFILYASWVSTAMSDMAGPIMNRKWVQQLP